MICEGSVHVEKTMQPIQTVQTRKPSFNSTQVSLFLLSPASSIPTRTKRHQATPKRRHPTPYPNMDFPSRFLDVNTYKKRLLHSSRTTNNNNNNSLINSHTSLIKKETRTRTMSLLRTIALRAPRAPLVTATITKKPVRFFSTSPLAQKDSGSAAKETIDSVNKAVGDAAVKGIEKGRESPQSPGSFPFLSFLTYFMKCCSLILHMYPAALVLSARSPFSPSFLWMKFKGREGGIRIMTNALSVSPSSTSIEQASESIKSSVGLNAKSAEGSAKELSGEAKGKASEVQGKASGMAGEAQGKASELMGEAKGKGQEVAGQAKGKAEEIKGKM